MQYKCKYYDAVTPKNTNKDYVPGIMYTCYDNTLSSMWKAIKSLVAVSAEPMVGVYYYIGSYVGV